MRSKNILSIAAFTVAFLLSTAFAGLFIVKSDYVPSTYNFENTKKTSCFGRHSREISVAERIEKFIEQDENNGYDRDKKIYQINKDFRSPFVSSSFADYAEAVSEYSDTMDELSAENMPRDFEKAWLKHKKVWRDYSDFLDNFKDSSVRAKLKADALDSENNYSSEITDTWIEVLRVGRNYGAEVY